MSVPSTRDVAWKIYLDSLSGEDRWAHCGSQKAHDTHTHAVSFNEGTYTDIECVGTPLLTRVGEPEVSTTATARERPSWDDFFAQQLVPLARRATCDRGRSAAIFVRENDQLAAGYVGSPPGMPHCDDVGHLWDETGTHCLRTIHAEQNAMLRALRHGISLRDTTVYCTMLPCFTCAKLMVGVGVYRVVALHRYHDSAHTTELFDDAHVAYRVMTDAQLYEPRRAAPRQPEHTHGSDQELTPPPPQLPGETVDDDIRRGLACPTHRVRFSTIGKCPDCARTCPHGDEWMLRHGVLINFDELEWGEREKL